MKKLLIVTLCSVLMLGIAACSKSMAKEPWKVDIRGEIIKLSLKDGKSSGDILIEGKVEKDTSYDKATISITNTSKIVDVNDNKELSINDLKQGMKVEVIFTGSVRESYPVQADAKLVRILN